MLVGAAHEKRLERKHHVASVPLWSRQSERLDPIGWDGVRFLKKEKNVTRKKSIQ
jgi:hypothetical protein